MKKLKVSVKEMDKFAGRWVVIDPVDNVIIAVADDLKELETLITRPVNDKRPSGTVPAAFKVPFKDEGPYVLGYYEG